MECTEKFINSSSSSCSAPSKNMQRKELGKLLTNYIQLNDLNKIEELLSAESNFKILKENRFICPFTIAVRTNNLHLFDYFNKKGFKLRGRLKQKTQLTSPSSDCENKQPFSSNQQHCTYSRALIEAIKCSNTEAVDLLIDLDINVNSNNYKYVPLQIAYNIYSVERDRHLLNKHHSSKRLEVKILFHNDFLYDNVCFILNLISKVY